ncbi:MAG: NRDE family protein [Polynucleobacter sp.]|jgi:uncharacterized protein with NRDE domain|nr:NRDE family protein [Polynucleobacter sp.]
MCIILFAINSHPDYPFVVAANRDEFYARPTKKIDWWSDYSHVLGARDQADVLGLPGTALGLSQKGKFSAITNIRAPSEKNPDLRTRGELTAKFLSQSKPIHEFITDHQKSFLQYNGFNLLLGDLSNVARPEFFWVSNRLLVGDKIRQRKTINPTAISAGLYGLSNAMLDTPWPKVRSGVAQFAQALARDSGKFNQDAMYFNLLADNNNFSDQVLPSTGVSQEWEKALAPIFIQTEHYGTRSSTLLRVRKDGMFQMIERSFQQNELTNTSIFEGQLEQSTTQDR